MEKILLLLNAQQFDQNVTEFACRIAALAETKLTGVVLKNIYANEPVIARVQASEFELQTQSRFEEKQQIETDRVGEAFLAVCRSHNIEASVIFKTGEPIQTALAESRFADLLIVHPLLSFYEEEGNLPSHFTKEILANAECPVLLAPEKTDSIDEIVFCYDGSVSSVYAIRQFTYLFPELTNVNATLLMVQPEAGEGEEAMQKMAEYLQHHYPAIQTKSLEGNVKDELFAYFFLKAKMLIVMGAYGRNMLSTLLRKSNADILIRSVSAPVFITHR